MKIFISNIHFSIPENELRWHLEQTYGLVYDCILATDREGNSRSFAFVDMEHAAGLTAIAALDGKKVLGRRVSIREATTCHQAKRPGGRDGPDTCEI
jgi:RNA recognition motif-containing protein